MTSRAAIRHPNRREHDNAQRDRLGGTILCCVMGLVACPPVWAGKDIDLDRALETIESSERRAQSLQWKVQVREGKVKDPMRPETATWGQVRHQGHVVIEHFSGRYRVDLDSVMRWIQGVNDHVAERNTWSFDGVLFRDLNYTSPGKVLPRIPPQPGDDIGRGRIYRAGEETNQFEAFRLTCGIGDIPPNHFGEPLSALMRHGIKTKREVRIVVEGDLWKISVPERQGDSTIVVEYDPRKDAVLRATWQNGIPESPWSQWDYELQEVDGFWVPKTITRVNLFDKTIWQSRISDVKLNIATPHQAFELVFPPWSSVTDSRKQLPN